MQWLQRKLWAWYRRRQRTIDRQILFPTLRRMQPNPREGMEAIRLHISMDAAWRFPDEWREEGIE